MKIIENDAGKQRQLSEAWIKEVAKRLPETERKLINQAIKDKKIRTALAGVNRETKEVLFFPITIKSK